MEQLKAIRDRFEMESGFRDNHKYLRGPLVTYSDSKACSFYESGGF